MKNLGWDLVGEMMKNERLETSFTQKAIAELIGCSDKKVRRFEQGKEITDRHEFYKKYSEILKEHSLADNEPDNKPLTKITEKNLYDIAKAELKSLLPKNLQESFEVYSFIAGGCIHSIYNEQEPNDYDFFLTNKRFAIALRDYFDNLGGMEEKKGVKKGEYKGLPFILTENAISIGKYQIITQWVGSIDEVVSEFDFKHNQFYYYNGEIGTLSSFNYLDENKLVYNEQRARNIAHTFIRTIKFVERGWTISHKELSKMILRLNYVGLSENEIKSLTAIATANRDQEADTYGGSNNVGDSVEYDEYEM
ncbi:helix-turn-helix domain-containing protein [Paenibacillus sp. FSL H3-0286]|uniref:helix-turn-helix domain-containing protein n=1 Tax=Paenibacillus sp. FSL H3-0286 TaxID=2921427 RepID=UPI00324E3021